MSILREIDDHIFRPDDSIPAWMSTHKASYNVAGFQFPGLFNSNNYLFHLIMFIIVLSIEVGGALVLALPFGGYGADLGIIGGVIGSVGFIMDFIVAFMLSIPNRDICYFQNLLMLYTSDKGSRRKMEDKIKSLKLAKQSGMLVILFIAAIKIYFLREGFGVLELPVIVISFLFVIGAILHITCTEYFFAFYLKFLPSANSERSDHIQVGKAPIVSKEIYTTLALKPFGGILNKCPHVIEPTEEKVDIQLPNEKIEKRFKSIIKIQGLITDNDVDILCDSQEQAEQSRGLALELLSLQINETTPSKKNLTFQQTLPQHRQLNQP